MDDLHMLWLLLLVVSSELWTLCLHCRVLQVYDILKLFVKY